MLHFLEIMGPVVFPLVLIAVANVILVAWRASQVFGGARQDPAIEAGINTILFWGVVAAVLGHLGMYAGAYRAFSAVAELSRDGGGPAVGLVFVGLKELSTNPIAGLTICLFSALAWLILRTQYRRLPA